MSLWDRMTCHSCGHGRFAHEGQWTENVLGEEEWFNGACRAHGCACKGFEEIPTRVDKEADPG